MSDKELLIDYLEDLQRAGVSDLCWEEGTPAAVFGLSLPVVGNPQKKESNNKESNHGGSEMKKADQVPSGSSGDRMELLLEIAAKVALCKRCPELVKNRTQTVFGSGNPYSELVFIGEGPGADEDKQGLPFVGRCGQLLTDIIEKGMKIPRKEVYICNIVRCRPPGNRTPLTSEAECCRPFLDATLKIVAPKYICCLGSCAAGNLLQTNTPIGQLRGQVFDYQGIKVICTYHPAYLLRNPAAKAQTWEDIKLLMKIMGLAVPKK
ncbi:MAG: uracil-DNA glycosylase [Planctomycetia bacterium]|nr:uracil-DNA glycosylase [Planctomycetia bacterium]